MDDNKLLKTDELNEAFNKIFECFHDMELTTVDAVSLLAILTQHSNCMYYDWLQKQRKEENNT